MKRMQFEMSIRASPESVWDTIVKDKKFKEWTASFREGSYFEGSQNKGDKIRFLALNEKGEIDGMFSEIAESRNPYFISIRHLGIIVGGKEDTTSYEAKKWAPSYENYTLTRKGETTRFEVDVDVADEFDEYFSETWPKALAKLKEIVERQEKPRIEAKAEVS